MYCVKCGVKLEDGVHVCPLCQTVMHYEEGDQPKISQYSDLYPAVRESRPLLFLVLGTLILVTAALSVIIVTINLYGELNWGGYVLVSLALAYVIFFVPFWFRRSHPLLNAGLDFAGVAGLLLYICLKTEGHWFLSFAFPIVGIIALLTLTAIALWRFNKKAGFFIYGGLFLAIGLFSMLVELFECITFGHVMFSWSLYVVVSAGLFGLFLLLCGIIPTLGNYIRKKFYL